MIFLIIIGYAILMSLFRVTSFKFREGWANCLLDWVKIGLPVAIFEETIFRYGIMFLFLIKTLHLEVSVALWISAIFFSLTHFTWGMYRNGGEYGTLIENTLLTIGLTLFGAVCGKYYLATGNIVGGVLFHSLAIYAVQILHEITENEGKINMWVYDNGHQLLRSPLIWIILIGYYMI